MTTPGPDLDRHIATDVMRWRCCQATDPGASVDMFESAPATYRFTSPRSIDEGNSGFHPSTEMHHAWEVVGRMRAIGWDFEITSLVPSQWRVVVRTQGRKAGEYIAATAPLAICLAALRALELAGGR